MRWLLPLRQIPPQRQHSRDRAYEQWRTLTPLARAIELVPETETDQTTTELRKQVSLESFRAQATQEGAPHHPRGPKPCRLDHSSARKGGLRAARTRTHPI